MLKKVYDKSRKTWKVTFEVPQVEFPQGEKIESANVAGDFNEWEPGAVPMVLHQGVYTAELELEPGHEYQFRYLINGQVWCNDWHADAYVQNIFDEDNCVVNLPLAENQSTEG
jgi:hypothetical protein